MVQLKPLDQQVAVIMGASSGIDRAAALLLAAAGARVVVVWGGRDRLLPVRQAQEAAAHLPRARLAIIPAAGHLPQVERPAEVAAALSQFFSSHAANHGDARADTGEGEG